MEEKNMQILQLVEIDHDRRITLHKSTLEAVGAERGDEFILHENGGKLTLTPARDIEGLMEG